VVVGKALMLSYVCPHNYRDITDKQRRLAEITEMIHTASLVHDDVLDDCDTRRGRVLWALKLICVINLP
jgi:geranylgeranyl pyrophosphate synthase